MNRLSDITNQAIKNLLGYRNMTAKTTVPNIAINAGSAATVKTTLASTYINNGVLCYKAVLAAQSIVPTSGLSYSIPVTNVPALTFYMSIGFDGSGNVKVTQGSYVGQRLALDPTVGVGAVNMAGATFLGDGTIPDLPAGVTPIAVLKIALATLTAFVPGTTLLDAAGVTVTYFDVATLPDGTL